MKKLIPSLILAVISAVLLNLGFVRAASKWDPNIRSSSPIQLNAQRPSPTCDLPCACEASE
jgi:hypothetical protein